ncbi:MAG: V-type ATP synthase subunit D [Lachnospiraceae bacterium]|nr:V-type ATP synthase subunit D [Lachnospiraceae bacterium]
MASSTIIPTRMELTRLKKKLVTARKGHKLLKDKRDELMRQFLIMVRENKELREQVEKGIAEANRGFALARSSMSDEAVRVAFMAPKQKVSLDVSYNNIMSVNVPVYTFQTRTSDAADMFSYGYAFTSADLDDAVTQLADVFPQMLKLAQTEKSCQLMAAEIEKTRRRVNALEHVMIPQLETDIKYISMKLDENERSSQIRLMKVKDMMLEDAHHYSEKAEARAREMEAVR